MPGSISFLSSSASLMSALLVAGCATTAGLPTERLGHAVLAFSDGTPAGTAQLRRSGGELVLSVTATGIAKGAHGFHLHSVGKCEGPKFASAGGHLNPYGMDHGWLDEGGSHLGDLPNLESGGTSTTATAGITDMDGHALEHMFDADGTAIVIHARADDYRTDPSGDAGTRLVCGVLERG